jgi:hypothetical protein
MGAAVNAACPNPASAPANTVQAARFMASLIRIVAQAPHASFLPTVVLELFTPGGCLSLCKTGVFLLV